MMRFLTLLKLKLIDLLAMRSLMVVLILAPLLLGLIAGSANLSNQRPDIRLAVVDQDQSQASLALVSRLLQNGWSVDPIAASEANRLLLHQKVDGVITIEPGYSESLTTLKESRISYSQAEGSLVTTIVREAIAAAVLPEYSRRSLLEQVYRQYEKNGQIPPASLDADFSANMADYAATIAKLKVDYIGKIQTVPTLTFVVSDYSMEVFFLSIYAVLGAITLSSSDLRRRLASTRRGVVAGLCLFDSRALPAWHHPDFPLYRRHAPSDAKPVPNPRNLSAGCLFASGAWPWPAAFIIGSESSPVFKLAYSFTFIGCRRLLLPVVGKTAEPDWPIHSPGLGAQPIEKLRGLAVLHTLAYCLAPAPSGLQSAKTQGHPGNLALAGLFLWPI